MDRAAEDSSRVSKRFSKKMLTKMKWFVLFELFPLKRKMIFERYIVRLIGTPNQKLIKQWFASLRRNGPVVHESLGSELSFSESLILAQNERWRRG